MDLDTYIRTQPYGTKARIAREAGVFYTTVHGIQRGTQKPHYETAAAISAATGGKVSIAGLCTPRPKPAKPKRGRPERVITQRGHR
jgi:hypothetical protein